MSKHGSQHARNQRRSTRSRPITSSVQSTARPRGLSRRAWIGLVASGATAALLGERWWRSANTVDPTLTPITVYASPTCSCCHKWVAHLKENRFRVTAETAADVTPFKRKYGVPEDLWSCHTATVEGYVVEGHVPADVIQRLLRERPAVAGIAAPGMPAGSPGMEGPAKEPYEILSFTRSGETAVYAKRG